jgi:hypothetical protein
VAPPPELTTKACRNCASEIPVAAVLCKECKSYQDWRGWLSVSQTGLALAVALVSVIGSTAPVLIEQFSAKNSKLSLNFAGTVGGEALLAVANPGNRGGTILTGTIFVDLDPKDHKFGLDIPLTVKSDRSVPPAGNRTVAFSTNMAFDLIKKMIGAHEEEYLGRCKVQFRGAEFDGSPIESAKDMAV